MPYLDCTSCRDAGTAPTELIPTDLVSSPQRIWGGIPKIGGHGLAVPFMAERIWALGVEENLSDYDLKREDLMPACWWMGLYATRTWKLRWGEWAKVAGRHMWYGCGTFPDPPTKKVSQ